MLKKVYFTFFILCAVLSQGIFAKLLEEDAGEAPKFLVRQKRVIDRIQDGESVVGNRDAPYVVNIKKNNRIHCIGTILSHRTAITAARCVSYFIIRIYTVYSGSVYTQRGNQHNITEKRTRGHQPPRSPLFETGIALITVNPPFLYSQNTGSIALHSEPVLTGMEGIIAGWGTHVNSGPVETAHPRNLRSIAVQIMNHRECQNIYRGHFPITDEDICTYHPQKLCGDTDAGAAFVIDNQLVGIHIGDVVREGEECPIKPNIFILLQHMNYRSWIINNIQH